MSDSAYIHPTAVIIGGVTIGRGSSVWPCAVIRGDLSPITIESYTSIQDNAVIHCDMAHPVRIGNFVTVGHGAVIHGCNVGDCCVIGINSVVLNGTIVGSGSIVAAGAVVKENTVIPPFSLAVGNPAIIKEHRYSDYAIPLESALIYFRMSVLCRDDAKISSSEVQMIYGYAKAEALRLNELIQREGRTASGLDIQNFY